MCCIAKTHNKSQRIAKRIRITMDAFGTRTQAVFFGFLRSLCAPCGIAFRKLSMKQHQRITALLPAQNNVSLQFIYLYHHDRLLVVFQHWP
jgi:hypothetical protein